MNTYKVKSNLKHDGILYGKGQSVDLADEVAKPLIKDKIIVTSNADPEDKELETPQPPVNNVSREGDNIEGGQKIKPGKVEGPQPGDNTDDKPTKSQYKVLKRLEYPEGTVHEVDAVLELTDEEAKKFEKKGFFGRGLIEKVEPGEGESDNL